MPVRHARHVVRASRARRRDEPDGVSRLVTNAHGVVQPLVPSGRSMPGVDLTVDEEGNAAPIALGSGASAVMTVDFAPAGESSLPASLIVSPLRSRIS